MQLFRVCRSRRGEDGRGVAGFLDDAVLEHHQRVRPFGGDRQIVGDEEQADFQLVLQLGKQVEDALLDRDVERGGRLVCDQQQRPWKNCKANQHTLQHAAGQLMRVGVINSLGIVEPNLSECLQDQRLAECFIGLVDERGRLHRLDADRPHRVERVAGVLRDEPDSTSPQRPETPLREPQHLLAVELDAAGSAPTGGKQSQHGSGNRRFARARLADESEALAAAEFKPDVADDLVRSVGNRQPIDPEQWGRSLQRRPGGVSASEKLSQSVLRSHRLILFTERTVAIVTKAGA